MNVHSRIRGLTGFAGPVMAAMRPVNMSGGGQQIMAELAQAFYDHADTTDATVKNITKNIDELNASISALRIGGGSGNDLDADFTRAQAAVTKFLRTGNPDAMRDMIPQAAMSTDSNPDGGFTVPQQIDGMIQNQLINLSPMRTACGGGKLVGTSDYHVIINKRGATTGWVGERDPRTETETPQLGDIAPPMGELYAYPSITQWSLDDSMFQLDNFIRENVIDDFALEEGTSFINGDGMKKPLGLLTLPKAETADASRPFGTLQFVKSGKADGFATTAPGDALIDLVYAVSSVYRAGPGVGWQMNSATAGAVRKLKDGQGNYLWQEATTQGQPPMLLGYPVWENPDMPDIAADAFPIAFGNWRRGYLIVDRIGTRILRDPYTKPGFVKFYICKRVGGAPTDSRAIKLLKISA